MDDYKRGGHSKYSIKKEDEERGALVVQSNELLRQTRYELNATEQKLVIYLISKIDKDDKDLKEIKMSIADYLNVCGISDSGGNYEYIKKALKNLRDKSWWIASGKSHILFSWIDMAMINEETHIIHIKLSYSLKPYLLELKENFTKYQLINVMVLKSKYAIRLYEVLKSYEYKNYWIVSVSEFREILQVQDKYKAVLDLRKRAIDPAVKEINELTDILVTYEQIKEGRNITEIKFKIREKRGINECLDVMMKQNKVLKR